MFDWDGWMVGYWILGLLGCEDRREGMYVGMWVWVCGWIGGWGLVEGV